MSLPAHGQHEKPEATADALRSGSFRTVSLLYVLGRQLRSLTGPPDRVRPPADGRACPAAG
jgi:hypothetical protein